MTNNLTLERDRVEMKRTYGWTIRALPLLALAVLVTTAVFLAEGDARLGFAAASGIVVGLAIGAALPLGVKGRR